MTIIKIIDSLLELRNKLNDKYCRDHKCCKYNYRFQCPLYNEEAETCAYYAISEIVGELVDLNNSIVCFKGSLDKFTDPDPEEA